MIMIVIIRQRVQNGVMRSIEKGAEESMEGKGHLL